MAVISIAMPRLGMTMEEGTIVEWPIPVGERVKKGQTVLIIETEKAEAEIEATSDGIFRHAFIEPGETVPCGALLGAISESADEAFDADAFESDYQPPPGMAVEKSALISAATPAAAVAKTTSVATGDRNPIAPAARALAKKLGLDTETLVGTGPGGRVTKQDVEAAAAIRERLVQVADGVGLEVLRAGVGDPVLLLPGFGTDISSFALQSAELAKSFEVVGVNPRGVGDSDAPALELYEVSRAADDIASLIEAPAHIVGASLGAATAIELALRHPEKVRSLALITPFLEATPRLTAVARAWCRVAAEASPEAVAAFLAPWLFGNALLADDTARERILRGLAQGVRRVPTATLERAAAGMSAWSGTRTHDLGKIAVPTEILAGGADLLTPDGASLADAIAGARCHVIDGCGHALAIDAAVEVTRRLQDHLASA